jgi:hypothetical protein
MASVLQSLDIRKMRRSQNLRNLSPEAAQKELETILFESLNLQNSGSRTFQKSALKELEQIRKDLLAKQINAGTKQDKFVGVYSHIIDQLNAMEKDNEDTNKNFSKGINAIQKSIPSTDTFIAALMTANPLVGYGAKILRDIARSRKEANSNRKSEEKKKLQLLKEQEAFAKEQLVEEQKQQELASEQKEVVKQQKREYKKGGVYRPLLIEIRNEIMKLNGSVNVTNDDLENVNQTVLKQIDAANDNMMEQINSMEKIEKDRERNEKLVRINQEAANDYKYKLDEPVEDKKTETASKDANKSILNLLKKPGKWISGVLGGLMGSIGGIGTMLSMSGMLEKVISPIKFLFSFGTKMARFAGKFAVPVAIITTIYDFLDGFFNADEIAGKKQVNIKERIEAGLSNVFAVLGKLVDWAFNFAFGKHLFDTKDLNKKIYKVIDNVVTNVVDFVQNVVDNIQNTFKEIMEAIKNKIEYIKNKVMNAPVLNMFFGNDVPNITQDQMNNSMGIINILGNDYRNGIMTNSGAGSFSTNAIKRAEIATQNDNITPLINTNVDNSTKVNTNNTILGNPNTSNQNNGFRKLQDQMMMYTLGR